MVTGMCDFIETKPHGPVTPGYLLITAGPWPTSQPCLKADEDFDLMMQLRYGKR